jgi:hypothetical protein
LPSLLTLIPRRKPGQTTKACSNVEERRFKRRVERPKKSTRLQPPGGDDQQNRDVIPNRAESPVRNLLFSALSS